MFTILRYIRQNWFELLIMVLIFSNLYPRYFPRYFYYIGIALTLFKMMRMRCSFTASGGMTLVFLIVVWMSTLINIAIDVRPVIFTAIVVVTSAIYTSFKMHLWKRKLMQNLFVGFAASAIVSLISKALGYNYQVEKMGHNELLGDEFSGVAAGPMWNSAASAVAMIFFSYLLFRTGRKKLWITAALIFLDLGAAYSCIISASRSAFAFGVLACALLLYFLSENMGKILKYALIFGVILSFSYSFFYAGAERMLNKQKGTTVEHNSRTGLWAERMAEFNSSPIYGVGFAVHGVEKEQELGRSESGSSWLAILAQTGAMGFICIIVIWLKSLLTYRRIKYDPFNILCYALLIWFTLHSMFEGYMFQSGWYMCFICWLCVGIVNEAAMYRKTLMQC